MPLDKTASPGLEEQLREACATLDRRLRAGETARAEDVLYESPELKTRSEFVLELAYTEYVTRDALGEEPDVEEWFARFPELAQDLRELFEVHRFVEQSAQDTLVRLRDPTADDGQAEPVEPAAMEVDSDRRFGNYELIEEIGRGGMGVVYKARQLGLRRIVALKLVLAGAHAGPERYERFQAEAEMVGQLAHPNIVQIHEVGALDGRPFLSLEYVEGGGLDRKTAGEPWLARDAAALVVTLAVAMQHAHERGIVHRDLKPANVLLTKDGVPKITDFGLAKRLFDEQSGQTASGAMLGTPSYMAPEQASGNSRDSGAAADVYALGAILYELLTGRPPFRGATLLETLEQVRSQDPVSPRQLVGRLPRDLETICLKCLQKQPGHRYATSAALADDLQRFVENRPIQARPVTAAERAVRWSERNPLLATLAASLVVLIVAGLIVGPWVAVQQAALRHEVQRQLVATEANLLAARSRMAADEAPQRSVLLAVEGLELPGDDGGPPRLTNEQALRDALARTSGVGVKGDQGALTALAFTPDGQRLITGGANGTIRISNADSPAESMAFAAHRGAVLCATISPGGDILVTAGDDGRACLWNLRSKAIQDTAIELTGFRAPLGVAAVSAGDRWLFLADRSGLGRLYELNGTQPPQLRSEIDLKFALIAGAFHADATWLAVGGVDHMVHAWPINEGGLGEERTFTGHEGAMTALAFDPRRPRLASASADCSVRIWPLDANETTSQVLKAHTTFVSGVSFSPDGRWLVSTGFDRVARRWDLDRADWESSSTLLTGHSERVIALAISPDSRWLATASRDKSVRISELASDDPNASTVTLRGHDDAVQAIAFDPLSERLASASADGAARIYDLAAGLPTAGATRCYRHGATRIQQLALSPSGRWIASSGNDAVVRVWDRDTGQLFAALPQDAAVRFAAFSTDDRWLATVEYSQRPHPPKLWDLKSDPAQLKPIELRGHTQSVECLLFDQRSKSIITGSYYDDGKRPADGTVRRWKLPLDESKDGEILARHQADVGLLTVSGDGGAVTSIDLGGNANRVAIADTPSSSATYRLASSADGLLSLLALSPHDRFAAIDLQGNVLLWERNEKAAGAPVATLMWDKQPDVRQLAASQDGQWLAAVDARGRVLMWNLDATDHSGRRPNDPTMILSDARSRGGVQGCAISPDNARLVTFAKDGLIRAWSLAAPDRAPVLLAGHQGQVQAAAFTADSRTLISAGYDGTIREWPMDAAQLIAHAKRVAGRELTALERRQSLEE